MNTTRPWVTTMSETRGRWMEIAQRTHGLRREQVLRAVRGDGVAWVDVEYSAFPPLVAGFDDGLPIIIRPAIPPTTTELHLPSRLEERVLRTEIMRLQALVMEADIRLGYMMALWSAMEHGVDMSDAEELDRVRDTMSVLHHEASKRRVA